jgi:hypothetical protein
MEITTLQLCRSVLMGQTLKVGADDFREVAPLVLTALVDLNEAIKNYNHSEAWPQMSVVDNV